jgi:tetratricopeptide (TPR) repeat protein
MTDAELAMVNEAANNDDLQGGEKKGGNRLVRAITYPFRAIGRLFGRGKKDDNKFHRLSEKDVKKFETTKLARVIDARTPTAAPTNDEAAPASAAADSNSTLDPDQALARIYLEDGRKAFNNNDLNAAVAALTRAVSLDAKLYDAHNLLGIAYETKGLRTMALESLEASLKGDKDQPEHLNDYGYLLMKNGDYLRAIKYMKRAVKAKPDERFLNNLALAQVQVGKFDDAYKSFERAVGEFQARLNLATRLQRLGLEKEAIKHLEIARSLQPTSTAVLAELVSLYQRTGKAEEAAEANKVLITLRTTAASPTQP